MIMKNDIEKIIKSSELYDLSSNHFDNESLKLMIDEINDKIEQLFFEKKRELKNELLEQIVFLEQEEQRYIDLTKKYPNDCDFKRELFGRSCRIYEIKNLLTKI